jgi:hypothetical protein
MHATWLSMLALCGAAWLAGCCTAPTVTAAAGKIGPYVSVNAGHAQSGLVLPPSSGWPPRVGDRQGPCVDERGQLEANLGVTGKGCPELQEAQVPLSGSADQPVAPASAPAPAAAPAPTSGDADAPIASSPAASSPQGYNLICYDLGGAMLAVEYAQMSAACGHVVGLAVFAKAGGAKP